MSSWGARYSLPPSHSLRWFQAYNGNFLRSLPTKCRKGNVAVWLLRNHSRDVRVRCTGKVTYVPNHIHDPNYVRIFDTTLRDGEQAPGATLTIPQKLDIAKQLWDLRVDVIEAGFPAASPDDYEAVRQIAEVIGNSVDSDGFVPVICALARVKETDLRRAWDAVRPAKLPRVLVFIATSDIHMQSKLHMTPEEVVATAVAAIHWLKEHGCHDIEFGAEDAGRSDPKFLQHILAEVIKAGATTVNVPDTTGWNVAVEYGELIEDLMRNTPGAERVVWSTHCHDDLGLATANSLAGAVAGARQIECTINGIGERAGNASLEEVVMALSLRSDRFGGLKTGVRPVHIYSTSQMVSNYTGMLVQPHKAIVGANAFSHESGIHQDGVLKDRRTYENMAAQTVGREADNAGIVLGKLSGRNALKNHLKHLGYELTQVELSAVFERFKRVAEKKSSVADYELLALLGDETPTANWQLLDLQVVCNTFCAARATVQVRGPDGLPRYGFGTGAGPVDAVFNALKSVVQGQIELVDYSAEGVICVAESNETLANVRVLIRPEGALAYKSTNGSKLRRCFSGAGSDGDIVVASARAYINAVNKCVDAAKRDT